LCWIAVVREEGCLGEFCGFAEFAGNVYYDRSRGRLAGGKLDFGGILDCIFLCI
jgi:hypothetical protein